MLIATTLLAATLWGSLEPGPHAVGFTQLERYDYSRTHRTARSLDGKPREGERARPVRVSIWYPAMPSNAAPLTFGDYVDMVAGETRFGALTDADKRRGEAALYFGPLLGNITAEQRAKLRTLPARAVRDAKAASGKFPLILYSLGSAALAQGTPEYLASHGYVVVQAPRAGAFAGLPPDNRDALDLETKLRDMDFLLNVMREFPSADVHNLATIGFSAGGRWALAMAMKNADVRAVVSLDSVMLFNDPVTDAWKRMTHYDPDSVRVPVLHMTRAAFAKQDDLKTWEALRYADRTLMVFDEPVLDHWDFQSIGYVATHAGFRAADAPKIEAAFETFNRTTLAFLDAHLKGRNFHPKDQPGVRVSRLAAQPAPITTAELMNAILEDGTDAAIAAYRRAWKERGAPPLAEGPVNLAGYTLLGTGRVDEGVKLLALNAEAWPASANVYDSLADAYLAAGDSAKALEMTKKAAALLEGDASPPERKAAIKGSIDAKLKQLGGS